MKKKSKQLTQESESKDIKRNPDSKPLPDDEEDVFLKFVCYELMVEGYVKEAESGTMPGHYSSALSQYAYSLLKDIEKLCYGKHIWTGDDGINERERMRGI